VPPILERRPTLEDASSALAAVDTHRYQRAPAIGSKTNRILSGQCRFASIVLKKSLLADD
jgi:hypothetical protein